ncbi:hypothetical protein ATANTOWER_013272 [Ataeniobius toweri]|uniref:Uncharacterized protein n=1 Tax=Ataeniobius toweri TaxID=208326 RepID=A0ABU7AGA6_9TELE|nr:hypothetical protein [Ataeniobius toweri]
MVVCPVSLYCPVMNWRPVQGVPLLSPNDRSPPAPLQGQKGIENGWMDVMYLYFRTELVRLKQHRFGCIISKYTIHIQYIQNGWGAGSYLQQSLGLGSVPTR